MIRSLALFVCLLGAITLLAFTPSDSISEQARRLHFSSIVVDTHDDTTQRFFSNDFDLGQRNPSGHIDIPRMREGGLNAIFFSIWIDGRIIGPPAIAKSARPNRRGAAKRPEIFKRPCLCPHRRRRAAHPCSEEDRGADGHGRRPHDRRRHPAAADLRALGVRYMTLTHFKNNNWADSSTDKPAHNGLTAVRQGRRARDEPLGHDGRHLARRRQDLLRRARASPRRRSSRRTPRAARIANHPRNMTDDMIRALAKNGGVMMINYHAALPQRGVPRRQREAVGQRRGGDGGDVRRNAAATRRARRWKSERIDHEAMAEGRAAEGDAGRRIVEHIDHAVKVAGADHVGLGSDFDGATMPMGWRTLSCRKSPTRC